MSEQERFKDHLREAHIFSHRILIASVLIIGLTLILLVRYYNLQIIHHRDYATESDKNRILVQTIPPKRGLIYDRNGVLLADNRPSYTLTITPEQVKNLSQTIVELQKIVTISKHDIADFHKFVKGNRRPYQPVPLRYRLTEDEMARIAVNEYRLQGVDVEAQLVRHYPQQKLFAHTVGYVGKINPRERKEFNETQETRYKSFHSIGKIGLEKQYEDMLFGEIGYHQVEVNARMQVLRQLEPGRRDPIPGANLHLHMDARLQQVAYQAMHGKRGAIVALDISTGGVLAMLSAPSYDPNVFVTGISFTDYKELTENADLPLFDRTIQGQYPPASTIKPMLGLGALEYQIVTSKHTIYDPGYYQLENDDRLYRDWKKGGHGLVNLHKAIVQSSDTYFYDLAFRMGIDRIHAFGSQFGFGYYSGIDIPNEYNGLWPSRKWKRKKRRLPWFPGDTLNVGIGQGDALATPLQLAVMTATIANRGKRLGPQLVKSINEQTLESKTINQVTANDANWSKILNAMYSVIHKPNGTARAIGYSAAYKMAGKTGTAQVVSIKQNEEYDIEAITERQRDHALFIGFAPFKKPKIAVAVLVENGGSGSSTAAPIARKLFDLYLLDTRAHRLSQRVMDAF